MPHISALVFFVVALPIVIISIIGSGYASTFTTVYSFNGTDGANPYASVIFDSKGNLYSSTYHGGDLSCAGGVGCGTVFELDSAGKQSVLYSFTDSTDGCCPGYTDGQLVRDTAGNLYGVGVYGGTSNDGVVFKVDSSGKETVLHTFSGSDGKYPEGDLIRDKSGNLYGVTYSVAHRITE